MAEPLQIETRDRASIFNAVLNEWSEGWQAVFRPSAAPAAIDISAIGNNTIIAGVPQKSIRIVSLFFTVAGEVNVTLNDGAVEISGPMDFGGASEPRGISIPFPYSPLEISVGNGFQIILDAAVQVSGSVCYFYQ